MTDETLRKTLETHGQSSVLRFWSSLDDTQKAKLKSQLEDIDFQQLKALISGQDKKQDFAAMAAAAQSPPSVRADGSGASWTLAEAVACGERALSSGEVGAIIVAGGQGTRLGFDQPKGMFPIGPVSNRTLFQFFADRLVAVGKKYGVVIPLYVMTSEATDSETREYFQANDYLGLDPNQVRIFKQGTMPAVDAKTGELLLAQPDSLALSPDGHGGTVRALQRNGCLDDCDARGVKYLAYIQVDNPLANLCDPALIGHHLMAESELTTQVVRKRYPTERVGNVVLVNGDVQIIEYSDLPDEAAEATDENGELKLWAGNIAVHVIDVDFLKRVSQSVDALPFHRASKKVPYVNDAGEWVEPTEPNAVKFERFIFDLLPQAKNAFVVESLPSEAFAPVKNAEGAATDTASLARQAVSDLYRGWFESAGIAVPEEVLVEINPRFALTQSELSAKVDPDLTIEANVYLDE
ncbi:UDPGP type 1 family protein [Rubripirellula amarantea]|uniref:Putative uridylyltransferase n=1 Tax=Rubripirellula amarantea TaxID=2527999 RepID=A0A5C5WXA3_9BACT|nr:UDPGP type 1 family protein [Rubripirellula amarantea]MDA8743752.1 UDPGP type 1 family protein [Rubripirellula amarantea]TWT54623.1 putative uridylyltransferase [Rubripirellula amarantea]